MQTLSDYDFHLPKHLIAQRPLPHRMESRLLVMKSGMNFPRHEKFENLLNYLNPGDALVLNNTKVLPARFFGKKSLTGGKVEMLLSRALPSGNWIALVSSKRRLLPDAQIDFPGNFTATIVKKIIDEPGAYEICFSEDIVNFAERFGQIPLPPYIERDLDESDVERYQTVFADPRQNQAVAAPTAGLHFDQDFLKRIQNKGVHIVYVTLHVGPGTFLPMRTDNIDEHQMHAEPWTLSPQAAEQINDVKSRGGRVIAIGTTSVRVLESAATTSGQLLPGNGLTKLFIRPGFRFQIVDGFVTNFHLPKTTLLLLVAAALGRERLLCAYEAAIANEYRFFSYGDACLFDVVESAK